MDTGQQTQAVLSPTQERAHSDREARPNVQRTGPHSLRGPQAPRVPCPPSFLPLFESRPRLLTAVRGFPQSRCRQDDVAGTSFPDLTSPQRIKLPCPRPLIHQGRESSDPHERDVPRARSGPGFDAPPRQAGLDGIIARGIGVAVHGGPDVQTAPTSRTGVDQRLAAPDTPKPKTTFPRGARIATARSRNQSMATR